MPDIDELGIEDNEADEVGGCCKVVCRQQAVLNGSAFSCLAQACCQHCARFETDVAAVYAHHTYPGTLPCRQRCRRRPARRTTSSARAHTTC